MSTTGWIVLGVIVVLVLWIIMIYNQLVAMRQRVGQSFADVDVQLKQRHDLIPTLVETVKGYASHERGTLDDVIKARNSAMSAQGPAQVSAAENQLSGALGRLIALSEAYPDLKANANFQQLAGELSDLDCQFAHVHVFEAHVLNATSAKRTVSVVDAAGRAVHYGTVCQGGTGCVATGQDRRLGDYFANTLDTRGCVLISTGDTMLTDPLTGAPLPTSRPLFIRQTSGPALRGRGTCP